MKLMKLKVLFSISISSVVISLVLLLLLEESLGRSLLIILSLTLWTALVSKYKKLIEPSLLMLILVLPFNITYQLPQHLFQYDPYTNLIISNYLIPTLSILDIFLLLFTISLIWDWLSVLKLRSISLLIAKEKNLLTIQDKKIAIFILISSLYFAFHYLVHIEWVTLVASIRQFSVILSLGMLLLQRKTLNKWIDSSIVIAKQSKIYIAFLLILVFQVAVGLMQVEKGASLGIDYLGESKLVIGVMGSSFWNYNGTDILRAYGTFPHPNLFAGYLLFVSFLAIYLYFIKYKSEIFDQKLCSPLQSSCKGLFAVVILVHLIIVAGLIITLSRAALASYAVVIMAVILGWMISISKKKRDFKTVTPSLFVERYLSTNISDDSVQERVELILASFDGIRENLLIGVGSGRAVTIYNSIHLLNAQGFSLIQPVHNIFLLIILEHGLIGGSLIILGFVAVAFYSFVQSRFKLFTFGLVLSVVIVGSLDHFLVSLPQGLVLFMLLNLLILGTRSND